MLGRAIAGDLRLTIDGIDYRLSLDINALADFEKITGKTSFALLDDIDAGRASLSDLRALFWAALQEHHQGTDLRAAGRLLQAAPDALRGLLDATLPPAGESAGNGVAPKASP